MERIAAGQARTARLLGVEWPPQKLLWSEWDLPRLPASPRISHARERALRQRLGALDWLRIGLLLPTVQALQEAVGLPLEQAPTEAPLARADHIVRATN